MMKLGTISRLGGRRLTFREWVDTLPEDFGGGRYLIISLLNPSKFPSGAVVFSLGDEGSVKLSLKEETYRQLLRTFRFRRGQDRAGIRLFLVVDGDGNYYVDSEADEKSGYVAHNWGWKFTEDVAAAAALDEDEVPF